MQTNDAVDEAFLKITTKAERHLCGIFDCVLLDGSPDPGYIGRGETLERKWRAVIPHQAKEDATADHAMTGLALIHLRISELAALLFRHSVDPACNGAKTCLQWNSIVRKLRKPTGALTLSTDGTQ